jgi:lipid II:glycine glycyltransferase (peptidoglycan interpeptide bridge formation enzyme)
MSFRATSQHDRIGVSFMTDASPIDPTFDEIRGSVSQGITVLNPLQVQGWDRFALSSENYSFFHSSHWAKVLHESYGYNPVYFALIDNGTMQAVMPCMEIKSVLTGKRGVSLPFTDYCEPIIGQPHPDETVHSLLKNMIEYGEKAAWRSLELRGNISTSGRTQSSYRCYGHTLEMSKKEDELFSSFRDSTKRNIKKAIKEGVKMEITQSLDAIRNFYRLNCLTRKEHGLPPQPFRFFEQVYRHVLSQNMGVVVLASHSDRYIAGALFVHFGERAIFKYGASDKQYQHHRANNLVMWEAIRWYSRNGYQSLCFGRTEPDNEGLLQFKRGWNATERTILYYKYDIRRQAFINGAATLSVGYRRIFHHMPIPLLKMTGSLLYKHSG